MNYTLQPNPKTREYALTFPAPDERGANLAHALGARHCAHLATFYLTPARADKWRALYDAGFFVAAFGSKSSTQYRRKNYPLLNLSMALLICDALTEGRLQAKGVAA